jgi:hypothetical protein
VFDRQIAGEIKTGIIAHQEPLEYGDDSDINIGDE